MSSRPPLQGAALRKALRDAASKHLDLTQYELFLFGSEAGASGPSRSDIDVGIRGSQPVPPRTLQKLREELESLRTLRMFDLVDFAKADDSFKKIALQHVE